ncbi:hypothetical protein GCM10023116_30560 [Kistimonas scapharcae]|uniref:Uncharacterized protein n=1 Tax=Kistimonas scapharcae TaxID=1036133 RepID=A0ABP8V3G6_9GAMM
MKWYSSVIPFLVLLVLCPTDLPAVQPSAPPYYDLPPSYEEATTYTLYIKAGEEKHFDISELLRLAHQGYTTIMIWQEFSGHFFTLPWQVPVHT